jgi:hypothetical protein
MSSMHRISTRVIMPYLVVVRRGEHGMPEDPVKDEAPHVSAPPLFETLIAPENARISRLWSFDPDPLPGPWRARPGTIVPARGAMLGVLAITATTANRRNPAY